MSFSLGIVPLVLFQQGVRIQSQLPGVSTEEGTIEHTSRKLLEVVLLHIFQIASTDFRFFGNMVETETLLLPPRLQLSADAGHRQILENRLRLVNAIETIDGGRARPQIT